MQSSPTFNTNPLGSPNPLNFGAILVDDVMEMASILGLSFNGYTLELRHQILWLVDLWLGDSLSLLI